MARNKTEQRGVGVTTPVAAGSETNNEVLDMDFGGQSEAITVRSVSSESLMQYKWYRDLPDEDRDKVKAEGQGLAVSLLNEGRSKLAVGQHLYNLNRILTPHNAWTKFLKQYNFNVRKAHRRIAAYTNAARFLPETVIQVAAIRNVDILSDKDEKPLGRYTEAVKLLPPPEDPTPDQADKYLNEIVAKEKEIRKSGGAPEAEEEEAVPIQPQDPQTLLKECYKFCALRFQRLPNNAKTKQNFLHSLFGMLATKAGASKIAVTPMAIPEEFQIGRGRPRTAVQ